MTQQDVFWTLLKDYTHMTINTLIPEHQQQQPSQEQTEENTYAILKEGSSRLPDHIQCAKCNQIKPRAAFKKQTTHAQAKGWGKSGRYKLEVFSKNCELCRPKPRPPRMLTPKELRTRAVNGDLKMGAVVIDNKIKQRIQDGKDGIRAGIRRKMEKKKINAWQPMWENLCAARTKARKRMEFLKSGKATPTPSVSVISYAEGVLFLLRRTADIIKHNKRWAEPLPENTTTWTDLLTKEDIDYIQTLFEAIPHQERVKMRHTSILSLKNFVENPSTTNQGEVK
jgi:hypothetical protein